MPQTKSDNQNHSMYTRDDPQETAMLILEMEPQNHIKQ